MPSNQKSSISPEAVLKDAISQIGQLALRIRYIFGFLGERGSILSHFVLYNSLDFLLLF